MHRKINRLVRIIKQIEIPSTPIRNATEKEGITLK
jgi:hypothetical protein